MKLKATALLSALLFCLTLAHAQQPGTIKIAKPKSNAKDTASQQKTKSNQTRGNFPDLQPDGFDLGAVWKSPQDIGLAAAIYGAVFTVGKERNKSIGLTSALDWYVKGTKNTLISLQLGVYFWTPAAKKILFIPGVVFSRVPETDTRYFAIRPEIRYIITRRIAAQAGLQFDLKSATENASPLVRVALLYRFRVGTR